MKKLINICLALCLTATAFAQTTNPAPNRASEPVVGYPITDVIEAPALKAFAQNFDNTNVGFMHVYAKATTDPLGKYLMRGEPATANTIALLPAKFQRMAKTGNATVHAVGAIKGINENLYLVRFDGMSSDRIEMFAIRGDEVEHVKTLAYRECSSAGCRQLDSYLTDVNGDGDLDLIQMARLQTKKGDRGVRTKAYTMDDRTRKWKKTRELDLPENSLEFYDPSAEN